MIYLFIIEWILIGIFSVILLHIKWHQDTDVEDLLLGAVLGVGLFVSILVASIKFRKIVLKRKETQND